MRKKKRNMMSVVHQNLQHSGKERRGKDEIEGKGDSMPMIGSKIKKTTVKWKEVDKNQTGPIK